MAERGAYLTGTAIAKPSLFEIVAQRTLAATLEPAAKKIITILASVNPDKYSWMYQWSDEIYLILIATLQNYYLNNYSASFSETFYGLKRIVVKDDRVKPHLDPKRRNLSLIILVLFPYLQRKIELLETQNNHPARRPQKWKSFLIQTYKIARAIKELFTLYQYLMYLSNHSKYPTLPLRLLSTSLTYSSDHEEIGVVELIKKLGSGTFGTGDGLELLRITVVRSIEASAFFLQFIQWWNQERHDKFSFTSLPIPPRSEIPEYAKQYKGICPVCRKRPRIHTAVATSGFVYVDPSKLWGNPVDVPHDDLARYFDKHNERATLIKSFRIPRSKFKSLDLSDGQQRRDDLNDCSVEGHYNFIENSSGLNALKNFQKSGLVNNKINAYEKNLGSKRLKNDKPVIGVPLVGMRNNNNDTHTRRSFPVIASWMLTNDGHQHEDRQHLHNGKVAKVTGSRRPRSSNKRRAPPVPVISNAIISSETHNQAASTITNQTVNNLKSQHFTITYPAKFMKNPYSSARNGRPFTSSKPVSSTMPPRSNFVSLRSTHGEKRRTLYAKDPEGDEAVRVLRNLCLNPLARNSKRASFMMW